MEFRIRPATADDWAAYREIRLRMLAETPDAYGSQHADEVRLPEERWRERAAGPMLVLAYADDNRLVGTATGVTGPGHVVLVVAMYVDPAARGLGLAGRLVDAIAAAARERGARRLVLHVTAHNRVATRSYLRAGFSPTGRTRPLARDPRLVEVEMALQLTPGAAPPASSRDGAAPS